MNERSGVALILLAEESFQVFNAAQDQDQNRTDGAEDKHALESSYQQDHKPAHNPHMVSDTGEG